MGSSGLGKMPPERNLDYLRSYMLGLVTDAVTRIANPSSPLYSSTYELEGYEHELTEETTRSNLALYAENWAAQQKRSVTVLISEHPALGGKVWLLTVTKRH